MNKLFALGGVLLMCGFAGVGCQNTAEGAKEDTANNTAAVGQAADKAASAVDKAGDNAASAVNKAAKNTASAVDKAATNTANAAKETTANVGANVDVRPKVSLAIKSDSLMNNTANEIHVAADDTTVTLTGHVLTDEMKQKATQITEKTLKEDNAKQTVQNNLTVTK